MTKINVGLIGLGRVSQLAYLKNLIGIKSIKSISICDKKFKSIKSGFKKYNIKKTYLDFQKMLKKEELDIVFVIVNRLLAEKISEKFSLKINLSFCFPKNPLLKLIKKQVN